MTKVTPESHGAEYHAAGVALCRKLRRNLWPFRDDPAVAHTLGLAPATGSTTEQQATEREENAA